MQLTALIIYRNNANAVSFFPVPVLLTFFRHSCNVRTQHSDLCVTRQRRSYVGQ